MKKVIILIGAILLVIGIIFLINYKYKIELNDNMNNNSKIYLQEMILEQIMYDYNYLTGNTEETTREYFDKLKNGQMYSKEVIKKLNIQEESSFQVVMKIQNNYDGLIKELSTKEKEDLDEYLLEQTLKFYYENMTANV